MTSANIWLVVKSLLTLLPLIISMVRDNQIKNDTAEEILAALAGEFNKRLDAAKKAGEGELPSEDDDPYNRARNAVPDSNPIVMPINNPEASTGANGGDSAAVVPDVPANHV